MLLPEPEGSRRLRVQRLLCPRSGQTVSLLPDFCLPHRQHGPAILGLLLKALVLLGLGLRSALSRVRSRFPPGHWVAQSLVKGFTGRLTVLRAYLAGELARLREPPRRVQGWRRQLYPVVTGLLTGFTDPAAAFVHHGRALHDRFSSGLA